MPVAPIRLTLLNDFEVVVRGLAQLLEPFRDRVKVVELDARTAPTGDCDIVFYDTFGAPQGEEIHCQEILKDCRGTKLVVFTWNLDAALARAALSTGVSAYLSKQLSGAEIVDALERVHAGERIVSPAPEEGEFPEPVAGAWPGQAEGLSERESEVLAYIVQGLSNDDVARRANLSINTVKSYIRSAYRRMEVSSRSQAVLWGIDHGFRLVATRIRHEGTGGRDTR